MSIFILKKLGWEVPTYFFINKSFFMYQVVTTEMQYTSVAVIEKYIAVLQFPTITWQKSW